MKLIALLLIVGSSVLAAEPKSYELDMDLTLKGKKIGSQIATVKEGVLTKVTHKMPDGAVEMEITVTPKKNGAVDALLMKFMIISITKGTRNLIGAPQILAGENEKATISMGAKKKEPNMILAVTAKSKKAVTPSASPATPHATTPSPTTPPASRDQTRSRSPRSHALLSLLLFSLQETRSRA